VGVVNRRLQQNWLWQCFSIIYVWVKQCLWSICTSVDIICDSLVLRHQKGCCFLFLCYNNKRNSYVEALVSKSLSGVSERPIFTAYPTYDTTKSEKSQGFNLLNAEERAAAVETLVQLRHNMICACPIAKGKK
jgi:hypothetical protein